MINTAKGLKTRHLAPVFGIMFKGISSCLLFASTSRNVQKKFLQKIMISRWDALKSMVGIPIRPKRTIVIAYDGDFPDIMVNVFTQWVMKMSNKYLSCFLISCMFIHFISVHMADIYLDLCQVLYLNIIVMFQIYICHQMVQTFIKMKKKQTERARYHGNSRREKEIRKRQMRKYSATYYDKKKLVETNKRKNQRTGRKPNESVSNHQQVPLKKYTYSVITT